MKHRWDKRKSLIQGREQLQICGNDRKTYALSHTPPRTNVADTMAGLEEARDVWDDHAPSLERTSLRRRLYAVLGWSAGGFAALIALTLVLTGLVSAIPLAGGFASVVLSLIGFVGVFAIASRVHDRGGAHVLLWSTSLFYAVLFNLFAATFGLTGGMAAGGVAATAAAVLVILALAVAIGFGRMAVFVRWLTFLVLVIGTVSVIAPELWWVGLIAGFLLSMVVEMTLDAARARPGVPEPALAACLVAGVAALVLLVLYTLIRYGIRIVAGAVAAGAHAAR